jgi:CBS-domain-containing membrane protein
MKGLVVGDFKPFESPLMVREETDLKSLVREFLYNPALHHICVVDAENRLLGLINRKRLFQRIFLHDITPDTRVSRLFRLMTAEKSSDLMITHVITCREEDSIHDVIKTLIEHNIREIPVIGKKGEVLGFITILGLIQRWLAGET